MKVESIAHELWGSAWFLFSEATKAAEVARIQNLISH